MVKMGIQNVSADVLVTGVEERQGLAVVRALGSMGLRVVAAGHQKNSLGFFSRYTQATCHYPSPLTQKEAFIETILEAVERHQIPIVLPVVESTVIAIDEHRSRFPPTTRLAIPASETLEFALDKKRTYDLAGSLGIDAPRTAYPKTINEAQAFVQEIGYPVVLKPRAYASYAKVEGKFDFKIRYIKNAGEFSQEMQIFAQKGSYPMLQEYCSGISVPQSLVCANGKILGIYQHRRGRDYPLTGGVASVVISEPVDPSLKQWTESLMAAMKWDGIAQVEYRADPRTGRKVLFEINGRIWAPISAAIQLGLNFPYTLYRYVNDGIVEPMPRSYPVEKRFRYLRGDLIALEGYLTGQTVSDIAPLPSKWSVFRDMLKDFRPSVRSDVSSLTDPLPSVLELFRLGLRYGFRSAYYSARFLYMYLRRFSRKNAAEPKQPGA